MQIVEVKNNLVKISYEPAEENLALSGFIFIRKPEQAFIAQVIFLEATPQGSFAVSKLLFNFSNDGVVSGYDGSIPDIASAIDIIPTQELLNILPIQNPIVIGELAQRKTVLKLDRSLFEEKLLVCCENSGDNELLTKNVQAQLTHNNKKVLVIDLAGNSDFSGNKIVAGKNFKLPLNYETINFIYTRLDDAKAETKALIQDIFLEVQNYVKTLPEKFIPFESFKDVVDDQYQETNLVELVLLKNKLLKYYEEGIFAQEQTEFSSLEMSLNKKEATVLDLSGIDERIQREMISYAYSVINELGKEIYVIVNINDSNSDKKLLKQILTSKAYSTIICGYSYKYAKELKQVSKNLILFAPIQQQSDFATYNTFLDKLNPHEFIVYGQSNQHMPLIVKLDETPQSIFEESADVVEIEEEEISESNLLDEEIKKDVDEIYLAPKSEPLAGQTTIEDLTEDDLDFIEENIIENEEDIEENDILEEEIEITETEDETNDDIIEDLIRETPQTHHQEFIETATEEPPSVDILPANIASTPVVPIYSADIESKDDTETFEKGDTVTHPKYGKGTIEKLINYGSKTLCSIHFDNVGRRLLDPTLAEIKKI